MDFPSSLYGTTTTSWYFKLIIFWLSWLVFPALLATVLVTWRKRSWLDAFQWIFAGLFMVSCLLFIDARFIERYRIVENHARLKLGFKAKLIVISDYHLGLFKDEKFLERVVERVNAIEADAVLIAGDHTYQPYQKLEVLLEPLTKINKPVFSVPGNHDEEAPGPPLAQKLKEVLQQYRVVPVEYKHVVLEKFQIIGLGDKWAGKDEPTLLKSVNPGLATIVLAHNPDSAMQLKDRQAALVVSGHTHCGQVRFPFLGALFQPVQQSFEPGLNTFTPVPTWVSCGLGEVGLPLRFLNPPSIDILTVE